MSRSLPWDNDYVPQNKRSGHEQPRQTQAHTPRFDEDESEMRPAPRRTAARKKENAFLQFIFARPLDSLALATVVVFVSGIVINALAFQAKPVEKTALPISAPAIAPPVVQQRVVEKPLPTPSPLPVVAKMLTLEEVQTELKKRGLYKETVDGQMGSKTSAAIKEFQKQAGLRVTGELNDDVSLALKQNMMPQKASTTSPSPKMNIADLLSDDTAPKPKKPLTTASISASKPVLKVQEALASVGYSPGKVDGIYSVETRSAIERFEKDRKIPVTGQVNPRLMRELSAVTGLAIE